MFDNVVLSSAVSIAILGIGFGALLGVASVKFHVDEDPRVEAILEELPGANCGGCGFPGCPGLASAIAEGKAPVNACPVGGAAVAAKIGDIMGVSASTTEREAAFVKCLGKCGVANEKYEYVGISSCVMADQLAGGAKSCKFGCLGLGSCVEACAFDAIHVVDGIAVVDKEACVACKKCVAACPKGLIEMVPVSKEVRVGCSSKDKGKDVMANCKIGCIGCMLCQKNCPTGAVTVTDSIAHVDYSKCIQCGTCVAKCPKKVIEGTPAVLEQPAAKAEAKPEAKAEGKAAAVKEKVDEAKAEVKEKAAEVKEKVEEKAAEVKEKAEEKVAEAKAEVKEKAAEVKEKAEEVKEKVEEKAAEVKEAVEEKVTEVKEKAEEVKEKVEEKVDEAKTEVKDKINEAKKGKKK